MFYKKWSIMTTISKGENKIFTIANFVTPLTIFYLYVSKSWSVNGKFTSMSKSQ